MDLYQVHGIPTHDYGGGDFNQGNRDRKGTLKNFCDKDFAEPSGELSGAMCLKALVLMGNDQ